jgi:ferredoxin-NADP reductase
MEFQATLIEAHMLSQNNRHLRCKPSHPIPFQAGQFVFIEFPRMGGRFMRQYSIASSPQDEYLDFCVTLVPNGPGSTKLHQAQVGNVFNMRGPVGRFILQSTSRPKAFIATGSGVAPFRSMIQHALNQGHSEQLLLILGVRHEEGILYHQEWSQLENKHKNFRFIPTLSKPTESWTGESGYVQTKIHYIPKNADIYICGLKKMVDEVRTALHDAGFLSEHVYFERYD